MDYSLLQGQDPSGGRAGIYRKGHNCFRVRSEPAGLQRVSNLGTPPPFFLIYSNNLPSQLPTDMNLLSNVCRCHQRSTPTFHRNEDLNAKLENNLVMNNRQAGVNQFKNKLIKTTTGINLFVGQNPSAPNNFNFINKTKFLGVFLPNCHPPTICY